MDAEVRLLTRLLCEAVNLLEDAAGLGKCSPELQAWWLHHEEKERARVKREVLAKLTSSERRALGFK